MEPPICQTDREREGWRRTGGRVLTTHNALIYREGEGVVHGRRPAGYGGGGRPICSALGRSGSARLTKPPTQPGRAVPSALTNEQTSKITETAERELTVLAPSVSSRAFPASPSSGKTVHKRANWCPSGRYPQRSCQCVTVQAHPLPFKHPGQHPPRFALARHRRFSPSPPNTRRGDASSPSVARRNRAVTLVCILSVFRFYSCTTGFSFKEDRFGGDGCGFCGRTRSSHIFRLDDEARSARVEMGVVF